MLFDTLFFFKHSLYYVSFVIFFMIVVVDIIFNNVVVCIIVTFSISVIVSIITLIIVVDWLNVQWLYLNKEDSDFFSFLRFREKVKKMFYHAYDSYLKYAYPFDELKPLTCEGFDTWGR